MRLTIFLLTAFFLQVSANSTAQTISLNAKDADITTVFSSIEHQTGYAVFYNKEFLKNAKHVSVNVKDMSLEDFLKLILSDQPLTYQIYQQNILIKRKEEQTPTEIPPIDIHGRITDSLGSPLAGATITVKGSKRNVTTDENGSFNINGVSNSAVLVVSFVGYGTREINVDGRTDISASLKIVSKDLGDVTIDYNSGYQKIPKERATGSFAFVDNKLFNQHVGTDVLSHIEGNVSGLVFNKNTASVNKYDISIRGHSTLFANDQPLIVVDNFAYDGDIGNINPNDVESITVLKDAAAASIWGVRSGNGVIVITTKKGHRNQRLSTEFNANVSVSAKPDLYYDPAYLSSANYIEVEQGLFNTGYYDGAIQDPTIIISPAVQIMAQQRSGLITADQATAQLNALRKIDFRNDESKYLYQKAVSQQYAVNIRGGGEKHDFFLSMGYDNILPAEVGNKSDRITFNSNYNVTPVKNLTFSLGLNLIMNNSTNNGVSGGDLQPQYPYEKLADANGNPASVLKDYSDTFKDSLQRIGLMDWQFRPLAELGLRDNTTQGLDNKINVGLKYDILNGLSIEASYQYERLSYSSENYSSDSTYYARDLINRYTQIDPSGSLSYPVPMGGILQSSNSYVYSSQGRMQLNYAHFYGKSYVNILGGAEIRHTTSEGNNSDVAYGYDKGTRNSVNAINYLDYYAIHPNGSAQIPNASGFTEGVDNYISYFANGSYTYNNEYTLSLSGRIDHSNLFGVSTNQKAVPLYSAGFSWDIAKAKFYNWALFPYLRPRVTYGYNANINKNAAAITTIYQIQGSPYSNYPYAQITSPGNPELRWEKVRMINFGIDYATKSDIISGSIEFYLKNGINLFGYSPLPPATGQTTFFGNTASTKGSGWDIVINTKNINHSNFKWTTGLLFSTVTDKVEKYDVLSTASLYIQNNNPAGNIVPLAGRDEFGIYSYKWAGLDHATGNPMGYVNGKASTDYATIINANSLDSMTYSGPARPKFFGSLRNSFSYKQFSLSINIIYKFKYYFRRESAADALSLGSGLGDRDYLRRWQKPGDESRTNVPSLQFPPLDYNRATFYHYSSVLIDKADNIRIQDITLSYLLTKSNCKWLPFEQLSVYSNISNLGIIWRANEDKLDPDLFQGSGIPASSTISFGISTRF